MGGALIILTRRMGEPTITYGLLLFLVLPDEASAIKAAISSPVLLGHSGLYCGDSPTVAKFCVRRGSRALNGACLS